MGEYSEAFVAFDTSKMKHAVAIADGGRGGEVRFLGEILSSPAAVERLIRKLAGRYGKLHICYEDGVIPARRFRFPETRRIFSPALPKALTTLNDHQNSAEDCRSRGLFDISACPAVKHIERQVPSRRH